jgi:hypothetical protein
MLVVAGAVVILAVDDARLLRMEFQTARLQPIPYRFQNLPNLRLTVAVNEAVIGIPLKMHLRIVPPKPIIQCMVKKHIRNDGAHHATNTIANLEITRVVSREVLKGARRKGR